MPIDDAPAPDLQTVDGEIVRELRTASNRASRDSGTMRDFRTPTSRHRRFANQGGARRSHQLGRLGAYRGAFGLLLQRQRSGQLGRLGNLDGLPQLARRAAIRIGSLQAMLPAIETATAQVQRIR